MGQIHVHRYLRPLLQWWKKGQIDPSFVITPKILQHNCHAGCPSCVSKIISRKQIFYAAAGLGAGVAVHSLLRARPVDDLRGKVVLITGGSRGLGLQLAREFARERCRIAICARDQEELDRATEDLRDRAVDVRAFRCDVTDRAQADRLIYDVLAQFGSIDVLVNNAGVIQVGPIEEMTVEDFERAMAVMFWGVLYTSLAVIPGMSERGSGRIVNITSIGAKVSVPHLIPYSCAKFAAAALSEGLHIELKPKGIHVLTVVPGLMRTGSHLNAEFKGKQDQEYAWFGLSATMPGLSMSAERAASAIVLATKRRESERILSLPANLLARFHGIFPGLVAPILSAVNRLILPGAAGGKTELIKGKEAEKRLNSQLHRSLTVLGRTAAEDLNEIPAAERPVS